MFILILNSFELKRKIYKRKGYFFKIFIVGLSIVSIIEEKGIIDYERIILIKLIL